MIRLVQLLSFGESYLAKKKWLACALEGAHGSLQQRIRNDKRKLSNTLGTGAD